MSGFSAPAPVHPIAPASGDGYVAGACNIGPWEIRRRRTSAIVALVVAVALFAILVAVDAPSWTRIAVLAPLWGGAISWLQARRRFCVAFALGGVSNFGDGEDTRQQVVDPVQRALDRRATILLLRDAFLLALVPAIMAVILPS